MRKVVFEQKDGNSISTADLGIAVEKIVITQPRVRTNRKPVPGRDGYVDYTDRFGNPDLDNRKVTIYCGIRFSNEADQSGSIINALHGRKMKIWISDSPGWYFEGRVELTEITTKARIGHFAVMADCYPWKLKAKQTSVEYALTAEYKRITLYNSRRAAVPMVIVSDGEVNLKVGDKVQTLSIGQHIPDDFLLESGETVVEAKANGAAGKIGFIYQEAKL